MKTDRSNFHLLGSCPDQVGLLTQVTGLIAEHGGNIIDANHFVDEQSGKIFMRYAIEVEAIELFAKTVQAPLESLAKTLKMEWRLNDLSKRQRVVFLVSKFDHCLAYLLHRWKAGDLDFDIPFIISNHEDLRELVEWYGIPYQYVPVPKEAKAKQAGFEKTAELIEEANPDTIVLARYMQIFPPWLCEKYRHRIINIHHSFLPSFVGAKPYHQAKERGVKLIGATCHYVTKDLDAGPIIEQDVARIDHSDSIADMIRLGKDVENTVLARGLRYHLEDRVLVEGNKTILFT